MTKASVLEEILGGHEVSAFLIGWINRSHTDDDQIRKAYRTLKKIGLSDAKIASQAQLLGMNPENIERNYRALSKLGLRDDRIFSRAQLLGMDPENIERNYQALSRLGLKDDKIASQAQLLGMNPETIERNYQALSKLGLKRDTIILHVPLLGRDPETIERNYRNHIGLLRQDYEDRNSGRELLTNQAQLLGISPETINANVQYLHSLGMDYNNAFLLGTTSQLKRKKMAWFLREVFDYRDSGEKKKTIDEMYDFVRKNPRYLIISLSSLGKIKEKIRKRIKKI